MHFGSANCGAARGAGNRDNPHDQFGDAAALRVTIKDIVACMAAMRQPLHPLLAHGWFNRRTYRFDVLRMLGNHGIANHIVGNAMWAHLAGDRECGVLQGGATWKQGSDF